MKPDEVKKHIQKQFSMAGDLKAEHIQIHGIELELLYLDSICDEKKIMEDLITPLRECSSEAEYADYLHSLPSCSTLGDGEDVLYKLLKGEVCLCIGEEFLLFNAVNVVNKQLGSAESETVIYGTQHSFSDDMKTNLNVIRHRYPSSTLVYKAKQVGRTELGLIYDEGRVDHEVVKDIKSRLGSINQEVIQSSSHLMRLLTHRKFSLFPTMMITERPDRVVLNLTQGKVVLMVEGNSFALLAPAVMYDFIASMDDMYDQFWTTVSLTLLRYMGILITILLPALYISVVSYHPDLFQLELALSIAGSRAGVPYPSYVEVLIMMFLIEALIEASLRLPKYVSAAATTVGGLILGQAAVQANLVSSIMIIVTSAIGIANFVVPVNTMSFAIRIIKYPFILLASLFGIFGVLLGFFCLIVYLADLRSFGKPYFKLFYKEKENFGKM